MKTAKILITLLTFTTFTQVRTQTPSTSSIISKENKDNCPGLTAAPWQGPCSADWAMAVTGAIEKQLCIRKKALSKIKISYQDLLCNCEDCHVVKGNGCLGGKLSQSLDFLKSNGPVGGGPNSFVESQPVFKAEDKGPKKFKYCLNYYGKECYNIAITGKIQCQAGTNKYDPSTVCNKKCNHKSTDVENKPIDDFREKGMMDSFSSVDGPSSMKSALNGGKNVLIGQMEIYEDIFFADKDQVYIHTVGQSLGVHAVQILGYKGKSDTAPAYWEVLVPFGMEVAGGDVLKVLAEVNHCNIEDRAYKFDVKVDYV